VTLMSPGAASHSSTTVPVTSLLPTTVVGEGLTEPTR
jgi:hypothetical protein